MWCCGGISASWCWSKWGHQYNPTVGCQCESSFILIFLSQHFQKKVRCLYLTIKTESKIAKDDVDIGNWYVQLWNTFQRCPWQLKFRTLWDKKNPNGDHDRNIDFMSNCNSSLYSSSDLFIFTGYKLLASSFPLEDKDLITFPLFCHPYHSTDRKSVLPGGLIDTYLIKGKAFFLNLYSALMCVALISDLKNSFVYLKVTLFLNCTNWSNQMCYKLGLHCALIHSFLLEKKRRQFVMDLVKSYVWDLQLFKAFEIRTKCSNMMKQRKRIQ